MTRLVSALGFLLVGALLALAGVAGSALSTSTSAPEPRASGRLPLAAYCRHLYGERATAYQPHEPSAWRCSVWRNGVWGLEDVELDTACTWFAGPDAQIEGADGSDGVIGGQVTCAR